MHVDLQLSRTFSLVALDPKTGDLGAAVVAVPSTVEVWGSGYLDLRVDDADDPVTELMRLYEKRCDVLSREE